jgi:hypothetical protein
METTTIKEKQMKIKKERKEGSYNIITINKTVLFVFPVVTIISIFLTTISGRSSQQYSDDCRVDGDDDDDPTAPLHPSTAE